MHVTFFLLGKNILKSLNKHQKKVMRLEIILYDHENKSTNDAIKKAIGKQAPYDSITSENALAVNRPFIQ